MPHSALEAPISPLRQRLIDDMNMRRFSHETGARLEAALSASMITMGARGSIVGG